MNRTGIIPNNEACIVYEKIVSSSNLKAKGLHVYDGHIRESDYSKRKQVCDNAFSHVLDLKKNIPMLRTIQFILEKLMKNISIKSLKRKYFQMI